MRFFYKLSFWLRALIHGNRKNDELTQELERHIELEVASLISTGVKENKARQTVLQEFGNVESLKEECRDSWGVRFIHDVVRDLRFTINSLRRSPLFSITVITSISLCVAANITVFSSLYGFILKPLPFPEPDRLVQIFNVGESSTHGRQGSHGRLPSMSGWTQYIDFKDNATFFEGFALSKPVVKIMKHNEAPQYTNGRTVSADFFNLLEVKPVIGRFFTTAEVDPGPGRVVVLTQSVWESEHQADPEVLGRQIRFDNGVVYTIIGVAPRSLESLDFETRFFIPYEFNHHTRDIQNRYGDGADLWARLKPRVSREFAQKQLTSIEQHWTDKIADNNGQAHKAYHQMTGIKFDLAHPLKNSLTLLQTGALFVLAVGCLNVMTLLIGRAGQRQQELAIRSALGANKSTLRRLLLLESSLLTGLAMLVGGGISWSALRLINAHLATLDPSANPVTMDGVTIITTLITGVGAGFTMGLLPLELLWKGGHLDGASNSRTASMSLKAKRAINCLVIGQVAFAFALLVGAGLLLRSFANITAVAPGFDAAHVIKGRVELRTFYQNRSDTVDLKRRVITAMEEIPGVQSAALSQYKSFLPYSMENMRNFVLNGAPWDGSQRVVRHLVTGSFFQTMGISMLDGRTFQTGDYEVGYIVDETFAQRFLKGRAAIGAELYLDNKPPVTGQNWRRIIGVVSRANMRGLEQRDGNPIVYTLMEDLQGSWSFTILLRTNRQTGDVIKDMQTKLRDIDPRLPLSEVETLQDALDGMLLARRGITILSGAFAGLALLLSVMGIYAVLAYDVLQRRKEIGIRKALGATIGQLISMILLQGLAKTVIGLGLGLVGAIATSHYLKSHLFDLKPFDPVTYLALSGFLLLVGLAASYIPAHRAGKVDPMDALRLE